MWFSRFSLIWEYTKTKWPMSVTVLHVLWAEAFPVCVLSSICKDTQSLKIEIWLLTKQSMGLFTVYSVHRAPMGTGDGGDDASLKLMQACWAIRKKALCLWSRNLLSSASIHKTVTGLLICLKVWKNIRPFSVLDSLNWFHPAK